jgi:putative lipoprotein (rSAM/lipoprotein system)
MRKILILFVLVLASCNKDSRQDWSGMEHFTFRISGEVTDNSGNPISGISVSALGSETSTLSDGTYVLEGSGGMKPTVFVDFTDMDGAANGGRYISASRSVALDYIKGKHGPYLGLFAKENVNVTLVAGLTPSIDSDTPL